MFKKIHQQMKMEFDGHLKEDLDLLTLKKVSSESKKLFLFLIVEASRI